MLQTSQVTVNRPQMMTGQRTQSDNFKTNVYYSCSKGKFWIDGKTSYYNQEFQKNLTPLCENKNKNTTSISPKTIGGKLLTNKTQQVKVNPQQFAQQVNNNNIEIQKTLGVQQPNGQLTTTDIDNLLKKLG